MLLLKERIQKIINELQGYRYSLSQKIERYKIKEATCKGDKYLELDTDDWKDFGSSQRWGGYDQNFWFSTEVYIPESFSGKPVMFELRTGREHEWDRINPQFKFYIDGKLIQGLDINHREVLLTDCARAGEVFLITLHAHSGMDDILVDLFTRICVVEPVVEEIYYNLKVPMEVIEFLPPEDKRRMDMIHILNEAINILDLRKVYSTAFFESVQKANTWIDQKLFQSDLWHEDVIVHCIGHTHIDVAWRWTTDQTRDKVVRSFATAIELMKQYPEYIFLSSQPQLYQFVKEEEPALYEAIKQKVEEGRWEIEGGMWVEPDCNLISGESMVRQILFGTRFFEKEFGVKNKILWLPDVFGYSAAMPQILKKSGIDYFVTSKLSWNEYNKIPYDTFMWKGLDGTEILTHFITSREYEPVVNGFYTVYGGMLTPSQVAGGWQRYQQKDLNHEVLHPYGYGDGGGGPTKEMLENARRLAKGIPGAPKVKMGKALDFFKKLEADVADHPRLPKWVGELYFEYHRGTYTSMAKNKKYNRQSEFLYQDIEWLSSLGQVIDSDFTYPQQQINEGWEHILLNQFHDILPGCSIAEVYETSHQQYENLIKKGRNMCKTAMEHIASKIAVKETSVVVFNSLGFERSELVEIDLPSGFEQSMIYDETGKAMKIQKLQTKKDLKQKSIFWAENIPAKGYKTFTIRNTMQHAESIPSSKEEARHISTSFFDMRVDEQGYISSLYDKVQQREVLQADQKGNVLLAFEDKPILFDAWDINMYYQEKVWEINEVESIEKIEEGPIRTGICIKKRFMDSLITQNIYLYEHTSRIDFVTTIDWREHQILVKAAFPVDIHADKATYEIQYGNVERPTHWNTSWDAARFEVCAHKWADLSEDGYGVSVLNDCKYGYDIKEGVMRLTLIKSGIYPNPKADQGLHQFTYSLYPHQGDWKKGGTVQEAYNLNCPLYAKILEPQEGTMPTVFSMIQVDQKNIIIDVVKKAEDREEYIIRMFEYYNRRSKVSATFCKEIVSIQECDLLENPIEAVTVLGNQFVFDIKPFEVKTFTIKI